MCTLTAVPMPGGARVAFNRDEAPARAAALPPTVSRVGTRSAAFPIDPESGGTWLAATDTGLVLAVLNVNTGRALAARPRTSRGTVIPALLGALSPWDAVSAVERTTDLTGLAPFRLVAVDREGVADFRWDGRATVIGAQLLRAGPVLFTSSGLGDERAEAPRSELFRALFACPPELWSDAQDTFHWHRWPERPELSVNMARAGARTVSTAVIELSETEVNFRYRGAAPHEPAATFELALPLVPGGAPMSTDALLMALGAASPAVVALGLMAATLASEDLTCVSAGVLVGAGGLDPWPALAGCAAGILLGDFGVWALGRWGGARLARKVPAYRVAETGAWLARHGALTAVLSRFLPGTRVPVFFVAGATRVPAARFLTWAAVAALVWVPLIVLAVAYFGGSLANHITRGIGVAVWLVPSVAVAFVAVKLVPQLFCRTGRCRLRAGAARMWHHEFWPAWVFYLPLWPWYLLLSLRYRSLTVWTASNPGIENGGGVVGESKTAALAQIAPQYSVPTTLVPPGSVSERVELALKGCHEFPVILKPDAGQRGAGVRKARDRAEVEAYFAENPGAVMVQPFHPGPFEAGVFYYRMPGESRGHLLSITDKVFPEVTGDGRSTLAELVRAHPRYRVQEHVFLARHATDAERVPPAGERVALATAGNHCQGTLFRDGAHLLTPELERAIDEAVRPFAGFFFGRLDVRYSDADEFRAGRGFEVIEVNGATSESTNLYDPSWSLWRAYAVLFRQWALAFRIGAANRARGHRPLGVIAFLKLVRAYYRDRHVSALSD